MRPSALEITAGDFALAAGHRLNSERLADWAVLIWCALPEAHWFRISLLSRCTAMLAGLRTLPPLPRPHRGSISEGRGRVRGCT